MKVFASLIGVVILLAGTTAMAQGYNSSRSNSTSSEVEGEGACDPCDMTMGDMTASEETCNSTDEDCDGVVDEGLNVGSSHRRSQSNGATGSARSRSTATVEECDNADDDCDEIVDEVPGAASFNSSRSNTARARRNSDGSTTTTETCDGLDDDCDGVTDEQIDGLDTDSDGDTVLDDHNTTRSRRSRP